MRLWGFFPHGQLFWQPLTYFWVEIKKTVTEIQYPFPQLDSYYKESPPYRPVHKDKWVQLKGKTLLYKILYGQGFACDDKDTHFELVTGYVYTAPDDMLDSRPGTLMLTDCIELCRRNSTCKSANFETGLCVLFGSSAQNFPGKKYLPYLV